MTITIDTLREATAAGGPVGCPECCRHNGVGMCCQREATGGGQARCEQAAFQ
jgi:hypothetical protein